VVATSVSRMDQTGFMLNGGGWLALALVNAGLAEQKNRSRLTWFLVSLFIGPLATFLIVVWQRAPVEAIERLHPVTNRRDRWFVLGALGIVLALLFGAMVAITLNWSAGWLAIVFLTLSIVAFVFYGRAAAAARRE